MIRIVTLVLAAAPATGCAGDAQRAPRGADMEKRTTRRPAAGWATTGTSLDSRR